MLEPIHVTSVEGLHLRLDKEGSRFVADFVHTFNGELKPRPFKQAAMRKFVARIPERKELDGGNSWLLAATDYTVGIIDSLWPRNQLLFTDAMAAEVYKFRLLSLIEQDRRADIYARYKTTKEIPANDYELHPENPLSPYQVVALHNALHSDGYALFMDPGTGKTPVVIARVCNDVRQLERDDIPNRKCYRVLIVAPKNARYNWGNEFVKFTTRIGSITVLRGDDIDRRRALIESVAESRDCEFQAVICGYEQLSNSWNYLSAIPWNLAVLDEMHYIKSHSTKRFKFAKELRDASEKRMGLTGTPITNSPIDLWSQFEFLGAGYSGFVNFKEFKSFYGVYEQDESGRDILVNVQNMPFLQERIMRHSFAITKEEALPDMPKKYYDVIECTMAPEQHKAYDEIKRNLVYQAEQVLANRDMPKSILIQNVLTMFLRLAQITSGILKWDAITDDDGKVLQPAEVELFEVNPKLEALIEAMREHPQNEKGIIWACFVPNIRQIAARLTAEGMPFVEYYGSTNDKERIEAERLFNYDPKYRWFLGNPASGGTALNLLGHPATPGPHETHCTWVIEYSQGWSPTSRWQGEERAYRRGAERPVRVTDFIVPGTVDEEIRTRTMEKKINAMTVADLRQIMQNIVSGKIE